jgi:hypothetical protein
LTNSRYGKLFTDEPSAKKDKILPRHFSSFITAFGLLPLSLVGTLETHRESLRRILQIQTLKEIVQNEIPFGKDLSQKE